MEFKLIKLKEGYIIVSDKEIKEADIHINLLTKEIEPKLKLTFEEIARKFNTDVKNIEIIK